eukprot:gb/GEZN01012909.1/.p1 GENE.gb/GEZN01012909.1/~~gb/GEZN01012909.1/.p1  ORF type:complete len:230 (+),score=15.31 gb/GEZN01012909.1/:92-691(+)
MVMLPILGITYLYKNDETAADFQSLSIPTKKAAPVEIARVVNLSNRALLSGNSHTLTTKPDFVPTDTSKEVNMPTIEAQATLPQDVLQWCSTTSHYTPSSRVQSSCRTKFCQNSSTPFVAFNSLSRSTSASGEPCIDFVLKSGQGLCNRENEEDSEEEHAALLMSSLQGGSLKSCGSETSPSSDTTHKVYGQRYTAVRV